MSTSTDVGDGAPERAAMGFAVWGKPLICGSQMREQFSPNRSHISTRMRYKEDKVLTLRPWVQILTVTHHLQDLGLALCPPDLLSSVRCNHHTDPTVWDTNK